MGAPEPAPQTPVAGEAAAPGRAGSDAWARGLWIVAAMAAAVYVRGMSYPLLLDDVFHVQQNPSIRSLGNLPTLLTSDYWEKAQSTGNWRPLLKASFALQYSLWGDRPEGWRIVNVLVFLGTGLLLARLGKALGMGCLGAAIAAGVYWLHPAQVEVVHNAVGLGDLAATACTFAVLGLVVSGVRGMCGPGGPVSAGRLALHAGMTGGIALLGLFYKEFGILIAPLALAFGLWEWGRGGAGRAALPRCMMAALAGPATACGIYLLLRHAVLGSQTTAQAFHLWPEQEGGAQAALVAHLFGRYVALTAWPARLVADWRFLAAELPISWGDGFAWLGIGAGTCMAALAARGWRTAALPAVALFVIGVALFLQLTPVQSFFAERHLTLALGGGGLLLGLGVERLAGRGDSAGMKALARSICAVLLLALAARSGGRIGEWSSGLALWESGVRVAPASAFCQHNYGIYLLRAGRRDEARAAYDAALAVDPGFADALRSRGELAYSDREYGRAIGLLAQAVRRNPDDAQAWMSLGYALLASGQRGEAAAAFGEALRLAPHLEAARRGLALATAQPAPRSP